MITAAQRPKVTLYCLRELHLPVLLPVYRALCQHSDLEVGFTAPVFSPGQGERAEEGLRPSTLNDLLQQGIPFWGDPRGEKFAAVVTADACYDRVESWGPVICVGHGTISKNIYFIDGSNAFRENYAALLCVPGPWYLNSFGGNMFAPMEATGFPKMDDLAKDWSLHQLKILARAGWQRNKKTILFAPTFNPEFTGMEAFYKHWDDLDPEQYQILFKLHGAADEQWRQLYRQLAAQRPNMYYVEDPNLIPYMFLCDLMVSDVSSAYVEFMALNKPLVLFDNPKMTQTFLYNPKAVEFQVRDAAHTLSEPRFLAQQIQEALVDDPKAPLRRRYARTLFPAMDGQICHRVAQAVAEIATGVRSAMPAYARPLNVFLAPGCDPDAIRANTDRAEFLLTFYTHNPALVPAGMEVKVLAPNEAPPYPFTVWAGRRLLPPGWDRIWALAKQWQKDVALALPMLPEGNGAQELTRLLTHRLQAPPGLLQAYAKYSLMHLAAEVEGGEADGMILDQSCSLLQDQVVHTLHNPQNSLGLCQALRAQRIKVAVLCGYFAI